VAPIKKLLQNDNYLLYDYITPAENCQAGQQGRLHIASNHLRGTCQ
jgi:hypothetical protein